MHSHAILLCCVLLAIQLTRADEPAVTELLFRKWTTHHGLPENHVRTIIQSRDGFLWIGTNGGVARFDGLHSKNYGLRDGLGGVVVLSLLESRDGTIWVGTLGGGLSAIRNGRVERTYTHADGLPSASVTHLLEDTDGRIWAANGVGLVRLERDRFAPIPGTPENGRLGVQEWFRDNSGVLWIALWRGGLWCWKDSQWSRPGEGAPNSATAFCEDIYGRLWIGQDAPERLWCRVGEKWQTYTLPKGISGSYPSTMAATTDGTVWLALYDGGGVCGLRSDGKWITPAPRTGESLDAVEALLATRDGQLWMGTSSNGIYVFKSSPTKMITVPGSGTNEITALLELAPGELLIGTKGRGWFQWKDNTVVRFSGEPAFARYRYGNAAVRSRNGSLWLATNEGLHEFRDGHRIKRPALDVAFSNLSVLALCEDHADGLWAGTSYGHLFRVRGETAVKIPYGAKLQSIDALLNESDGTLWIATRGDGLYRLRGNESRRYGREDGLQSELVSTLVRTPDGILWAGTIGGGLARREGERFICITTNEGLPDNTISQIIADDEARLWLGTNRGLAVFSIEDLRTVQPGDRSRLRSLMVNRFDGMLSEECTKVPPIRTNDRQLAFATTCGLVILDPHDFQATEAPPSIFIDRIETNEQSIQFPATRVSLAPGVERLEFQYSSIHLHRPEQLRFRCRLNGLDTKWNEVGNQRSVEYRNLAPGQYLFEVAASVSDGPWSAACATLEVMIAPSFWQTWWFRAVAALVTTGIVAAVARGRERLRSHQKIQALEHRHAIDSERARIARDLHDDIGATLTQVALLSELARSDLDERPTRAAEHLDEIFATAKSVTRALDEIVWAVSPVNDTLESFAFFIGTFAQNYARAAGLKIRLDIPEVDAVTPLSAPVRHHLYLALKEILNNVVKHAAATEIRVSLTIEPRIIKIIVQDNGCGFDTSVRPGQRGADGLDNISRRLEQIGGKYIPHSAPGHGTRCELVVESPSVLDKLMLLLLFTAYYGRCS